MKKLSHRALTYPVASGSPYQKKPMYRMRNNSATRTIAYDRIIQRRWASTWPRRMVR